jgi:membrane protein implicated in regulation of membrane protease activity
MAALTTVYWLCFGIGLVYVLVAGTLGAVSHAFEGAGGGDADIDHDTDFGVDHDAGFDVGADHDAGFDVGHDVAGGGPDIDVGAADFDAGIPDADLDVDADTDFDTDFDADVDADADANHDVATGHAGAIDHGGMPDWNPFSPLSVAGFLCAFGAAGLLATGHGLPLFLGLGVAAAGGLLMAFILWLVIGKFLFGMQGTSQARAIDMLGLEAEVITPVEHDMSGEIAYVLEGVRYTAPARLIDEGKIAKHETVRIRQVRGNMVYVEPRKKLLSE